MKHLKSKLAALAASLLPVAAFAEIPAASLTALTTQITDDVGDVATFAFGALAIVLGLTIGLKLVKKMVNRAT